MNRGKLKECLSVWMEIFFFKPTFATGSFRMFWMFLAENGSGFFSELPALQTEGDYSLKNKICVGYWIFKILLLPRSPFPFIAFAQPYSLLNETALLKSPYDNHNLPERPKNSL